MRFEFVHAEKANHSVRTLCRVLRVSPSGYYIQAQLKREGFAVGRKRVARLMRQQGLEAVPQKRFRVTTDSKHSRPVAPNHLARQFEPASANQAWATDITYVWTWQGWLYLAVIIDLFSRRVVGWAADRANASADVKPDQSVDDCFFPS